MSHTFSYLEGLIKYLDRLEERFMDSFFYRLFDENEIIEDYAYYDLSEEERAKLL